MSRYPEMTRKEILALPQGEQRDAYRSNPQVSSCHMDCRCSKCNRRYSVDVRKVDAYRVQCPSCNGGMSLRATTQEEFDGRYAMLRAQGEGRLFSLVRDLQTVQRYTEGLMPVWVSAGEWKDEDLP